MMKLINLELRKNKLRPYLWSVLWIFIFCLGFCFLMTFMPMLEEMDGVPQSAIDMEMFNDWSNFSMMISILFAISFAVLSAVMHTRFTIDEYIGKRAVLLFSYPESRRKILFAKCSLVFVFTALGTFICSTLALLIFAFASNAFSIMPNAFTLSMLPKMLLMSMVGGVLSASAGMVAMRIGFWKKSLVATVVTSVILLAPFGNIISFLPQYSALIQIIAMAVILVIALVIFLGLLTKVNKMEAL